MRKKTSKTKSESLGKSSQTTICSSLLGIAPNSQVNSQQDTKQQNGSISAGKPEIEATTSKESAKSLGTKSEFPSKSSQAPSSSVFQPKSPQLQRFPKKPQISSIPGIAPKERCRYRVTLGDQILGDFLTIDEAIALANRSTH